MLTILVGIPGSGKSTWAQAHAYEGNRPVIVSSDELRAVIGKDENDQTVSGKVFETMEFMVAYLLNRGHRVFVDATNYKRKDRARWIALAKRYNASVEVVVFPVTLETAKRQNANRARVVPEHVLDRMHANFEMPQMDEGINFVTYGVTTV